MPPLKEKIGTRVAQESKQVGREFLDLDLAYNRLLSPRSFEAFEGSREGTRIYLSDGTTVTTTHEPTAVAAALAPLLAEPFIAVTLPGLTPRHYFVCSDSLLGFTQGRSTNFSQGGMQPQMQLYVQLRSSVQFVIPQTSAQEFEAAIAIADGGPVRKVRIVRPREEAGGSAGFDAGAYRDLFLGRAQAVARG